MKTIRVTAQRKAHNSICPPLVLGYYLLIARWYEVVMTLPAVVAIILAVILSGCSMREDPSQQIMINSGTIGPEYAQVSEPVELGQLVFIRGHYWIVVEN